MKNNENNFFSRINYRMKRMLQKYVSLNLIPIVIQHPEDAFHLKENCKILLLRQDRISDVLISIPTIRALRKKYPTGKIDIVLSRKNHGVSKSIIKFIDKIWIYDKEIISIIRLAGNLRKENYDIVIDMLVRPSISSSYFIKKMNCGNTLGFDKENRDSYTHIIDTEGNRQYHIIKRTAELLKAFGFEQSSVDLSLEYYLNDEDIIIIEEEIASKTKRIRLGVNLSGISKAKYWGLKNYIEFINNITNKNDDIEVIVFSTIIYQPVAKKIIKETGSKLAKITTSINEYACRLSTCDIIITPGTLAVHLASAFRIPCIALYSNITDDDIKIKQINSGSEFIKLTTSSQNLSDLRVDDVIQACEKLLKN